MTEPCDKYPDIIRMTTENHTILQMIITNHLPHILSECRETKRWVLGVFSAVVVFVILGGLKLLNVF